jgi:protease IV
VIALISGTGASGSYMAACAATKVLAVPMAIVGSIGVISMRPMLYELLDKIGVRMEVTKAGRLKDMFSNFREPTAEEKQKEQALLDAFYERFVEIVAEARHMAPESVREIATGEIYTAGQAKELGLIDELGDLDAALDLAQSLSGVSERKVTYVKPHRGLRDRLLANTATGMMEVLAFGIEGRLRERRIEYR